MVAMEFGRNTLCEREFGVLVHRGTQASQARLRVVGSGDGNLKGLIMCLGTSEGAQGVCRTTRGSDRHAANTAQPPKQHRPAPTKA